MIRLDVHPAPVPDQQQNIEERDAPAIPPEDSEAAAGVDGPGGSSGLDGGTHGEADEIDTAPEDAGIPANLPEQRPPSIPLASCGISSSSNDIDCSVEMERAGRESGDEEDDSFPPLLREEDGDEDLLSDGRSSSSSDSTADGNESEPDANSEEGQLAEEGENIFIQLVAPLDDVRGRVDREDLQGEIPVAPQWLQDAVRAHVDEAIAGQGIAVGALAGDQADGEVIFEINSNAVFEYLISLPWSMDPLGLKPTSIGGWILATAALLAKHALVLIVMIVSPVLLGRYLFISIIYTRFNVSVLDVEESHRRYLTEVIAAATAELEEVGPQSRTHWDEIIMKYMTNNPELIRHLARLVEVIRYWALGSALCASTIVVGAVVVTGALYTTGRISMPAHPFTSSNYARLQRLIRQILIVVKVFTCVFMDSVIVPLIVGWIMDLTCLKTMGVTMSQRLTYCRSRPLTCSFLHTVAGLLFVANLSIVLSCLRDCLQPRIANILFLSDRHMTLLEPFNERNVELAVGRTWMEVILRPLVNFIYIIPAILVMVMIPVRFGYLVVLHQRPITWSFEDIDYFVQVPLELVFFHILIPFLFERVRYRLIINNMVIGTLRLLCTLFDLSGIIIQEDIVPAPLMQEDAVPRQRFREFRPALVNLDPIVENSVEAERLLEIPVDRDPNAEQVFPPVELDEPLVHHLLPEMEHDQPLETPANAAQIVFPPETDQPSDVSVGHSYLIASAEENECDITADPARDSVENGVTLFSVDDEYIESAEVAQSEPYGVENDNCDDQIQAQNLVVDAEQIDRRVAAEPVEVTVADVTQLIGTDRGIDDDSNFMKTIRATLMVCSALALLMYTSAIALYVPLLFGRKFMTAMRFGQSIAI